MAKPAVNDGAQKNVVTLKLTPYPDTTEYFYRGFGFQTQRSVNTSYREDADGLPDAAIDRAQPLTGSVTLKARADGRPPCMGDRFLNPYVDAAAKASVSNFNGVDITAPKGGIWGNKYSFSLVPAQQAGFGVDLAESGNHAVISYNEAGANVGELIDFFEAHDYLSQFGITINVAADELDVLIPTAQAFLTGGANDQMTVTDVQEADDGEFDLRSYSVSFRELMDPVIA